MKYILGVDPGFTGALAVYDPINKLLIEVIDMPIFEDQKGRVQLDVLKLTFFIEKHARDIGLCVIEDVHSMPNQGVVSVFRFGYSTGVVTGIISSYLISVHKTPPSIWKLIMNLSRDKDESRALAMETFPDQSHLFKLKKHADRAEAALLAVFGERLIVKKDAAS